MRSTSFSRHICRFENRSSTADTRPQRKKKLLNGIVARYILEQPRRANTREFVRSAFGVFGKQPSAATGVRWRGRRQGPLGRASILNLTCSARPSTSPESREPQLPCPQLLSAFVSRLVNRFFARPPTLASSRNARNKKNTLLKLASQRKTQFWSFCFPSFQLHNSLRIMCQLTYSVSD